ncbi:MAG: peptidylprolyl isomerase [Candidatus Paceibacterota bacterium]|jgi:cyclophilin family peptidyl-prolyl cis-trans isomerase
MKKNIFLAAGIVLAVGLAGWGMWGALRYAMSTNPESAPPPLSVTVTSLATSSADSSVTSSASTTVSLLLTQPIQHMVTIKTNYGTFAIETYDADAPKAAENFITLVGRGYYNNLTFHRVVKDFMIQGGDPNGNGTGGQSMWGQPFADELNPATPSYQEGYQKGVVAMANSGPNTNGSQFFIMLKDTPLPHNYTIFGKVVSGQEVVDAIGNVPVEQNGGGEDSKPVKPVIIENMVVRQTAGK